MTSFFVLCLIAYVVGSIPSGKIIAKYNGVDIQSIGTGNIGASNTFLSVGKKQGLLVLCADIGKAYLFMLLALSLLSPGAAAVVGIFLLVGNVKSVFLNFTGGKGIATGLGVFLAIEPFIALFLAGMWFLCIALIKYLYFVMSIGTVVIVGTLHLSGHLLLTSMSALTICLIFFITHRHQNKVVMKNQPEIQEV